MVTVPDQCKRNRSVHRSSRKLQKLNRRQVRWVMELAQFNFTLKHRPGHLNSRADLLSRHTDHDMGHNNNQDVTLLKEAWFRNLEVVEIDEDLVESSESRTG